MNRGAMDSKADVLLFIHADVMPPADFYNRIKDVIKNGYKAGFFSYKFDSDSWLLRINANTTKKDGWFAGGGDQCHFFERSTFEDLGRYCEDHYIMEDFHIINKIRESKVPFRIIDSPAIVSSRKYDNNSYLRVNLINLITYIKYKFKADTKDLTRFYKKWLNE